MFPGRLVWVSDRKRTFRRLLNMVAATYDLSKLSPRESEVLELASKGLLDKEIARELGLSLNTLRTYWGRIRHKAGEASRTGLTTAWVSEGLRNQGQGSDVKLDLNDTWWEFDAPGYRVRAGIGVSGRVGLTPDEWHSLEVYDQFLHPEDRITKQKLIETVAETGQEYVSFTERYLLPEGMITYHTFGQCFFEDGVFVGGKGHSVLVQSLAPHASVVCGLWSFDPSTASATWSEECLRILHLSAEEAKKVDPRKLTALMDPRDTGEYLSIFDVERPGLAKVTSTSFRRVLDSGEVIHVRGISRVQPTGLITGSLIATI